VSFPVQPGKIKLDKLVLHGGKKPIDMTKSWRQVFGKSIKATKAGGDPVGPDCE
jgi:hypothetical protein